MMLWNLKQARLHGRGWTMGAALCLAAWVPAAAAAQLAITEVMSSASTALGMLGHVGRTNGSDFFEVTNFGTNSLDLAGYRFADSMSAPLSLVPANEPLLIRPRESVIFVRTRETTNEAQFREWWGSCLPAQTQVRFWPKSPGLDDQSDGVRLYDPEGRLVDLVEFGMARPGRSFTYDTNTGEFGVYSVLGESGGCEAAMAGDIGSPGVAGEPVPLLILEVPVSQSVCAGMDATLSAQAGGLPKPGYQWFFNGRALAGAITAQLVISNVQPHHGGCYEVAVDNGFTNFRCPPACLTVDTNPRPPLLVMPPSDFLVYTTQTARFSVTVCAFPPAAYQWKSNDVVLVGETNRTLWVRNCTFGMSGTKYSVQVSNMLGATNASALLTVTPKPKLYITEIMPNQTNDCPWHEDWFELTNYDTNALNLQGYRFSDRFVLGTAKEVAGPLILQPGESVIFVEKLTAAAFQRWWGSDNLPPGLQIRTFTGMGLNHAGEALYIWNAAALDEDDTVDSRSFVAEFPGVSQDFNLEECYGGCDSVEGQRGAFRGPECGTIGSPGYTTNPPPRLVGICCDESGVTLRWHAVLGKTYELRLKNSLLDAEWTSLGTYVATNSVMTAKDATKGTAGRRFYQVKELQ